jgi:hypothetical protein
MALGWLYILSNPAMPGLIKIGFTMSDPEIRAKDLRTTGVPMHFNIVYWAMVDEPNFIEQALHLELSTHRHTPDREFFELSESEALLEVKNFLKKSSVKIELEKTFIQTEEATDNAIYLKNVDKSINKKDKFDFSSLPTLKELEYAGIPFWRFAKIKQGNPYDTDSGWIWPSNLNNYFCKIYGVELAEYGLFLTYILLNEKIPCRFFNINLWKEVSRKESDILLDIILSHVINTCSRPFHIVDVFGYPSRDLEFKTIIDKFNKAMPTNYASLPKFRSNEEVSNQIFDLPNLILLFNNLKNKLLIEKYFDFPYREIYLLKFMMKRLNFSEIKLTDDDLLKIVKRLTEGVISDVNHDYEADEIYEYELNVLTNFIFMPSIEKITSNQLDRIVFKLNSIYLDMSINENISQNWHYFTNIISYLHLHFKSKLTKDNLKIFIEVINDKRIKDGIKINQERYLPEYKLNLNKNPEDLLEDLSLSRYSEHYSFQLTPYITHI